MPAEKVTVSPSESPRDSEDHDSEVEHEPIQERYGNPSNSQFRRVASKTMVSFRPKDPDNPVNWRKVRSYQAHREVDILTHVLDRQESTWFLPRG